MPERAIILCRQSLSRPDSVSLDSQESRGRAYCERQGYTVAGVIREENTRGWREDRASMVDIRALAAKGGFEVLVAFDTSRVARKLRLLENLIHDLERHRVRLECTEQSWVGQTLMRQVVGAFDEERTRDIARHVAGAVRKRGEQGVWHGRCPFGYRRGDDHKLVIHEDEAAIVRRIFTWYGDGWRIGEIHRALNADSTVPPRPRGGRWSTGAIWKALRRDVYRGAIVIDPATAGNARFDGLTVEGAHPAIISRELWDRVQRRNAEVRPKIHDLKLATHWLEGRVFCRCGESMYFVVRRGRTDRLWVCRRQQLYTGGVRPHPCPEPISSAGAGWVERGVMALLVATLERAGTIPDERLRKLTDRPDRRAEKAADDLVALRRQRDNLIALVRHGVAPETVAPEVVALGEQIATAEREVVAFTPTRTLDTLRLARTLAADLAGRLVEMTDIQRRTVAEQMGLRVTVEPEERRVTLGFGEGFGWLGEVTRAGRRKG